MWKLGQIRKLHDHLQQTKSVALTSQLLRRWYDEQAVDPYPNVRPSRLDSYIQKACNPKWKMNQMSKLTRKRSLTPVAPSLSNKVRKLTKTAKSPHDTKKRRRSSIDRRLPKDIFKKPEPKNKSQVQFFQFFDKISKKHFEASKYAGVSYKPKRETWVVQRELGGRRIHGGYFKDAESAGVASDELLFNYLISGGRSSRAKFNFPEIYNAKLSSLKSQVNCALFLLQLHCFTLELKVCWCRALYIKWKMDSSQMYRLHRF